MDPAKRNASLPRPAVAQLYRGPLQRVEAHVPLPNIPPAAWTVAGVVVSLFAFAQFASGGAHRAAVVAAVLVADWLDGATARRFGPQPRGQVLDVAADRISEVLIFASDPSPLSRAMLVMAVANTGLVMVGRARGRHWALPLRIVYLIVLLVS